MKTTSVTIEELRGVFAVPPLARKNDARRTLDFDENDRLVRHIAAGGITRLLYGGNAFLYHITLGEYEELLGWLAGLSDDLWAIPSFGPSFGRAIDQAAILRRHNFPCAMMLPCNDPRDAEGIERGMLEIAAASGTPLILYLNKEDNFGADAERGLDAVARLVEAGVCVGIKYAVVRENPEHDAYLDALLSRVSKDLIISGIGERPAIIHLRDWQLPGFTTGSGTIAPSLSNELFAACVAEDYETAEKIRADFLPLEDLRDEISPAKVLHHATQLAQIAQMNAVPPFLSALLPEQLSRIAPVAQSLAEKEADSRTTIDRGANSGANV